MRPAHILIALIALIALVPVVAADGPAESKPLTRIAFGSGASQERPQPIWGAITAAKPDLFVFLGDAIFGDTDNSEVLKAKYAQLAAVPGYKALATACPVVATWGVHDFGYGTPAAKAAFLNFFKEPTDSPRWRRPGVYGSWEYGPPGKRVQLILLDTRTFRRPLKSAGNAAAAVPLLGDAQWTWFAEQLKVPAEVRIIGSSIPVVAASPPGETWASFPGERDRLYRLLRDAKAARIVILSGGRQGELSGADVGLGYPLFDITAGGLNMAPKRWRPTDASGHRIAIMPTGDNFGLMTIDWDHKPPRIALQLRDADGDVVAQQKTDRNPAATAPTSKVAVVPPASPKPPTISGVLTPSEAAKNVNKSITLEMAVKATGKARDKSRVFLNSAGLRAPDNFTVVLDMRKVADGLKAAGVTDPATFYRGKTVRVTGTVSEFRQKPQIVVEDAGQISVVDK